MPVLFDISASTGSYAVRAQRGALDALADELRQGVVLADDYFAPQLAGQNVPAIALPATEATKSLDAIGDIVIRMRAAKAGRNTQLFAIGGGAIQDTACFIASIYMRGMAWTYLPTTLLGMVDSCIGGKSSINVGEYKNILGTFHPPSVIWIDPELTASLSAEQRAAGLLEAAKICYCRGPETFAAYLSHNPATPLTPAGFEPIIALSLGAKKYFVEIDEFDRAERQLLNLGHTFGHALEGASSYRLSHGIAVGVGMLCALALSQSLLGATPAGPAPQLAAHVKHLLAALPHLPEILRGIDPAVALDRVKADKKHQAAQYRFVTFDAAGQAQLASIDKTPANDAVILAALTSGLEFFHV